MKKTFTKLFAALALLVFMTPSMVGWGQTEVTFVAGTDTGATSVTKDGITVSMSTMSRTDNYRCYSGTDMTVSCESGKTISSIVLTCTGSNTNDYGPGKFSLKSGYSGNYSYSGTKGTWSGGAGEIKLTASAQVRMTQIVVTYTSSGGTPTCATPTFSPAAGAVTTGTEVTISCTTEGVAIYYTMGANPADPTTSSDEYDPDDKPIITAPTTIKAIAVKENYNNSEVATASYTIKTPVPGYAIDFESDLDCYVDWEFENIGIHTSGLTCGSHDAGGSAWGSNVNGDDNGVATAIIQTEEKVAYPDVFTCYISKESGNTTASSWKIQVSSDDTEWEDIATLNSMTQNTWTEFTGNIKAANKTNVYVRLYYSGSTAKRAVDDISLTTYTPAAVEEPSITVTSPFTISTSVSISCVTDGATIYYTTDGNDPTTNSSVYSEPFTINSTTTIKAIAVKGSDVSTIASVTATKELAEPTVTINASGITNTNVYTGTAAGSLAATVTYNNAAITGATVTWSGNNDAVATIDASTGVVTLVAAGSVTFTASYAGNSDYSAKTATYAMTVINVDPSTPGTITTPYTVAQAIENTPSSGTSANVYIHGIVSRFHNTSIVGDGTNYRYYISDDGTTTTELLVYKGKGLNQTTFTDANDLLVGDEVTIYGGLTTYNNTKEIAANNYIVSLSRKVATPTFSPVAGAVVSGTSVTISTTTSGATIYYTTDGTEPTTSSTEYTSAITITNNTTLKAIAVKSGYTTSAVATAEYTILVTPTITVTAENPINVSAAGGSGELALTYSNFEVEKASDFAVQFYNANNEVIEDPNWIVVAVDDAVPSGYKVSYEVSANDGVARSTYFKVYALADDYVYSNLVTLTQAAADYATLPFEFTGGKDDIANTTGLTSNNLGSDYTGSSVTTKLKFTNNTNNTVISSLVLKLNEAPIQISYDIKGNSFSGGTFKVQLSEDGENYDDLAIYTTLGDAERITHICNNSSVKYIRWIYTEKSTGNVGLGNIKVSKTATNSSTLSGTNTITVGRGSTLTFSGTCSNASWLVIEEGGQLILSGGSKDGVYATFQREVEGYGSSTGKDKYILLANPTTGYINPTTVAGMLDNNYDLYYFDEAQTGAEWRNYKQGVFNLENGKGYLYANSSNITLNLAGAVPTGTSSSVTLNKKGDGTYAGFNLVGNPMSVNITSMNIGGSGCSYYKLHSSTGVFEASDAPIIVGEAFMVEAPSNGATLSLNPRSKDESGFNNDVIRLEVSNNKYKDVAFLYFGNHLPLTKINHLNDEAPMIYIHNESANQAVAVMNERSEVKTVNVNFEAKTMGSYTISAKAEKGNFSYMHLYDRLTGVDTDMLENDYTFIGAKEDAAGRFILRFEAVDTDTENEIFAYQNGNDIIINGEGELQIFDVMGRMVSTQRVNGREVVTVSSQGVYILRLIGAEIKTQKIVVR